MTMKKAEVTAYTDADEPLRLSLVPFQFIPGDRKTYAGTGGVQTIVLQAGWLGLETDEFKGWKGTHLIDLSYAGADDCHVFEVTRAFDNPEKENRWLWFPVMPRGGVEPYKV